MNTRTGKAYTPKRTKEAERTIAQYAMAKRSTYDIPFPITGPLRVGIAFLLSKKQTGDIDNYAKTVLDALNGVIWQDDKQIKRLDLDIATHDEGGTMIEIHYQEERP
jgi:Holliday junction resolvase RusA-like endonuclease